MKRATMTMLAIAMCLAIAGPPMSVYAASGSTNQVQTETAYATSASNEESIDEKALPETDTGADAQEADVQEPDVQEADTQEANTQADDAQKDAVPEADTQADDAQKDAAPETDQQAADTQEVAAQETNAEEPEASVNAEDITTWSDLQEAINQSEPGDKIVLAGDVIAEAGNTVLQIPEGKNLIIDMQGHVINRKQYTADSNGHAIQVNAGAQLALKNGTVTGGYAYDGGGIYCAGTFYGSNLNICGNKISGENNSYRGAGVYNKGSMSLRDCKLDNNWGNDGGAIYNDSQGDLMLAGVNLEGNTSYNHGGGGLVNYGDAFLTDCEITNNTAKGAGAGIWSNGTLAVSRCDVSGNTSAAEGGGICVKNGTMDLADSSVTNNTSADGGGIYIATSAAVVNAIRTVNVTGNTSKNYGGGGITNYGTLNTDGNLTITGNRAHNHGGGLWSSGTFSVSGHICIDANKSENTSCNNLYLKGGKVITVAGPIDSDSKIIVSGEKLPGIFTSGWSENNPSGDLNVIGFEHNAVPVLDKGEVNVTCSYKKRTLNPETMQVEEQMEQAPEALKAFPAQVSEGGWFAIMDSDTVTSRATVPAGKTVNLILLDDVEFSTKGIYVAPGGTLNIYGQEKDSGEIYCHGDKYQAGIGSNDETGHGTINIYSGAVAATGGDYGAGIGMGDQCDAACGAITIYGGSVYTMGGIKAAGIGGGNEGRGAKISIYGGYVDSDGRLGGAGIGAGEDRGPEFVGIYGGTVIAGGGDYAAGIGEGYDASSATSNGTILIKDGDVTAIGGMGGAGIGGGGGNNTKCSISIEGGNVNAYTYNPPGYGTGGAGIGAGAYKAFLGGGDFRGTIRISGGTVKAEAGGYEDSDKQHSYGAAGIGAGHLGDMEGTITITGGDVTAVGRCGGAAIGAGPWEDWLGGDCEGTINIKGGSLKLHCSEGVRHGDDDQLPHYIGAGYDGDEDGTLTFDDKINVWLEGHEPVSKALRDQTCRSYGTGWLYISGDCK